MLYIGMKGDGGVTPGGGGGAGDVVARKETKTLPFVSTAALLTDQVVSITYQTVGITVILAAAVAA